MRKCELSLCDLYILEIYRFRHDLTDLCLKPTFYNISCLNDMWVWPDKRQIITYPVKIYAFILSFTSKGLLKI